MACRAKIVPINRQITLIDDAGESTCYLVAGEKRALLIDTLNGREDLRKIVSKLTSLPVTVVNTHGHCDHIYGNVYFEEAYLHPADWALHDKHFAFPREAARFRKKGLAPCKLLPLEEDAVFDLGGIRLEVVPLKGHTQGSVGLLCREHRVLFSGDALNSHLWMQLDESASLEAFENTLRTLLQKYRGAFDHLLTGHSKGPEDARLADEMLEGVISLRKGECLSDQPYHWFGGEAMIHPFGSDPKQVIVYHPGRVDQERGRPSVWPPVRHIPSNPELAGLADVQQNIVFSSPNGQDLALTLVLPWGAKEKPAPLPLVVFVQGSGWTAPGFGYELEQMGLYARQGFAMAMVTHRNCLEGHPYPAYLQDVKTAIRFLRSHAADYNLDKNRVAIFGTSSGGNTALLAGLTGDDPAYRTAEYPDESDAVRAVVECFGPTDILRLLGGQIPEDPGFGGIFQALTQGLNVKWVMEDMSPMNHVKKGGSYPPFLLIHGNADELVPYDQLEIMYRKLLENGADARAICVDGAPHEGSFWSLKLHEIILAYLKEKL